MITLKLQSKGNSCVAYRFFAINNVILFTFMKTITFFYKKTATNLKIFYLLQISAEKRRTKVGLNCGLIGCLISGLTKLSANLAA